MVVSLVAFSGGRRLPAVFSPLVARVVGSVFAGGRGVVVGCASGADAFVRRAAGGRAVVFRVSSFGSGRGAFVRRSLAVVRRSASSGAGAGVVVFAPVPCPAALVACSPLSASGFGWPPCGASGSGSWGTAWAGVSAGLPLVVFPCGWCPSLLPASWGSWVACSGAWSGGFLLVRG